MTPLLSMGFFLLKWKGGVKVEIEMKDLEKFDDVLTLKEVADYLKVSTDSVKTLVKIGLLKCFRVGRLYRFTKEDILNFLKMTNKEEE